MVEAEFAVETEMRRLGIDHQTTIFEPELPVMKLEDDDFAEGISPRSATEFALLTWRERRFYAVNRTDLTIVAEYKLDD